MSRKVGIIIEAPRGSGDEQIFRWLAEQFCDRMLPVIINNRNKRELITDCPSQVDGLFKIDKCETVLIMYDLMPRFQPKTATTFVDPKKDIEKRLLANGISISNIEFICIKQMLETWLIVDEAAVRNYLIKKHKPNPLPGPFNGGKKQINNPKPKDLIEDYLSEYNPTSTGIAIIKEADLKLIKKRSSSFKQFHDYIMRNC